MTCTLCGSNTHARARCTRKREFETQAHITCLDAWVNIMRTENEALFNANTKWLTLARMDLIRNHLLISWGRTCTRSADRKNQIQNIYRYLASRTLGIQLNMHPHFAAIMREFEWVINPIVARPIIARPIINIPEEENINEIQVIINRKMVETEFECPVCYETIQNGLHTNCGHSFCQPCMSELIKRINQNHNSLYCPMCRSDVENMSSSNEQVCINIITVFEEHNNLVM